MRVDVNNQLEKIDFDKPIGHYLEKELPVSIELGWSVKDAAAFLRNSAKDLHLRYFYVVNSEGVLCGVISSHHLLFAKQDKPVSSIMDSNPLFLHPSTTVRDAVKKLNEHRLVALPVVDEGGKLVGMVEFKVSDSFQEEMTIGKKQKRYNEIFEFMGLSLERAEKRGAFRSFLARMPWLGGNLLGGFVCAAIVGYYHEVLEKALILAMFIPLVLTLSESIAMQAMTLSLAFLHQSKITFRQVLQRLVSEWKTAIFLGICAGILVELLAFFLHGDQLPLLVITTSIFLCMVATATFGVLSPVAIHAFKWDPRVAAGPIALMAADIIATSIYLSLASYWLVG